MHDRIQTDCDWRVDKKTKQNNNNSNKYKNGHKSGFDYFSKIVLLSHLILTENNIVQIYSSSHFYLSVCLSVPLFVCLFIRFSVRPFVCLAINQPVDNVLLTKQQM